MSDTTDIKTGGPRWRRLVVPALVGALVLAYVALTFRSFGPYLATRTQFEDDQRQHLLPVCAAMHPENFREGFLAGYAAHYAPPAYLGLLRGASFFVDPLVFCKWAGMALLAWTYAMGFLLGRAIGGSAVCGFITMALVVHAEPILLSTFSGLFRSFGFPLLLTCLYGLVRRRPALAFAALVPAGLLYPPVFLVCWLATAIHLGYTALPRWRTQRRVLLAFAAVTLFSLAAVAAFDHKPAAFGSAYTKREARRMPEWGRQDGRLAEFPWRTRGEDISRFLRAGLAGTYGGEVLTRPWMKQLEPCAPVGWLAWPALLGAALFVRPRPGWYAALLAGSLVLYYVARHVAFRIGWPDRYLLYALPTATILLFPLAWRAAQDLPALGRRAWRGLGLAAVGGVFAVTPIGLVGPGEGMLSADDMTPEWTAARALPPGCLFAGWPTDMDNLPLMAQKEAFIDYEHAYPLYKDYYAKVVERMNDDLGLIFATNIAAVASITAKYGLTHALIEKQTLTHEGPTPGIFAPFNDMAAALRRGSPPDRFVFNHVPAGARVHESGRFVIVDLRRWLDLARAASETTGGNPRDP